MTKKLTVIDKEIKSLEKDLTLKQRKFLKRYFELGNGTQAAMETYNCKDIVTAASIAHENLRKLQEPIKIYMETKGISLGKLTEVLSQGLDANRVISAVNTDKQANGASTDFIEVPDHLVRHKYLETASKWLGIEAKETGTPDNLKRRVVAEEFFGD